MSDQARGNEPDLFVASPADVPTDDFGPEPPKWPKVVGIISIVLGSLSLLCGGAGIAFQLFAASMMGASAADLPPTIATPNPVAIAVTGASTLWSILLIVAGAMTVGRKPVGRPLHLGWAAVAIVFAAVGVYFQLQAQADIAAWVRDNPDTDFARQQAQGGNMGNVIGLACGGILGFGWPLFTLVWFLLVKPRSAQVAEGAREVVA